MTKEQCAERLAEMMRSTDDKEDLHALKAGMKSIKRDIPWKVLIKRHKGARYVDILTFYECPNCKCNVDRRDSYCKYCGQALEYDDES